MMVTIGDVNILMGCIYDVNGKGISFQITHVDEWVIVSMVDDAWYNSFEEFLVFNETILLV